MYNKIGAALQRLQDRLVCTSICTCAKPQVGLRVSGGEMKLSLIFALIDIMILVAYPIVFLAGKMRQLLKIKR
jgi:hypothetical protein